MKQTKLIAECNCKVFDENYSEFRHENRKIVTVRDKGHLTEYRYKNDSSNHLAKYRVDGGLISDGAKCDFLLLNCERKQSYFIELKGSDISRAIDQIDGSIDKLKADLPEFAFFARIVLSRVNTTKLRMEKYLRLEKKVKSLKGNLQQQTRLMEEVI